jgi:hypothetical protein
VGDGTYGVVMGDLDGDGDNDIVSANYTSGTLRVLFNQGDGTFVSGDPVPAGDATTSVALGDIDGDGDLDAVAGSGLMYGYVTVLFNDGTGSFTAGGTFPTNGSTWDVALGDLDGDGDLDLAAANNEFYDQLVVLLNDGSGSFGAAYTFEAGFLATDLALGDVNGDGLADVVTDGDGYDAYLLLNQSTPGAPAFSAPSAYFAYEPFGVALGDVNGDGHLDLVTASFLAYGGSRGSVAVLPGDGSGSFGAPQTFFTGLQPTAVTLGDADGDGSLDAFTADRFSYTVSCLLNRGDGTLEEAPVFAAGGDSSDMAAGDLDGDGDLDLAVSDDDGSHAYVLFNQGDGTFVTQMVPSFSLENSGYRALALGDVDGDGDLDIVLTPENDFSYFATLLNDGSGNFDTVRYSYATYAVDYFTTSAALGDVNGDGNLDLVWSSYYGYVLVGLGDGSGTFADPARYSADGYDTRKVALGDLDGDGDPDLVAASYSGDTPGYGVAVLLNNGAGFDPAQTFYSGYNNRSLALGDLDGDGDLDVAVTGAKDYPTYTGFLYTLLGDGSGTFTPLAAQVTGARPNDLGLVDFDGDGDLDAVTANPNSEDSSVLLGAGDGTFALPLGFGGGGDPWAVATGDLDGDGRLDFATVTNYVATRPPDNDVYVFLQR